MDISISGTGVVAGGEYEKITISGSAKAKGAITATLLKVAGALHTDSDLRCRDKVKISGSVKTEGSFEAKELEVSGALKIGGSAKIEETAKIAGKLAVENTLKGRDLQISGNVETGDGIEAEKITVRGGVTCGGLLNAEEVEIVFGVVDNAHGSDVSTLSAIGGSHIVIRRSTVQKRIRRLPLLAKIIGRPQAVTVSDSIEGDDIALEGTAVPRVVGRVVAIGEGCKIDTVEYSESLEVSPDAEVIHRVKIEA